MLIGKLNSGGLIVSYACSSACSHCLYKSSPKRDKSYMTSDIAEKIFAKIAKLGCNSVHIGGGEPFLKPEMLFKITPLAGRHGVSIDYVETNASWWEEQKAKNILAKCNSYGINSLLVSISPFHNEFIPFSKTKSLISACKKSGINVFPWISDFACDLSQFDKNTPHTATEYKEKFGENYFFYALSRYSVRFNGRAAESFAESLSKYSADEIISLYDSSCFELFNTNHFHIDLYGNYLPGLCAGLSIDFNDLGQNLREEKYPLINLLSSKGINGIYELAKKDFSYEARGKFIGKCHLCLDIRKKLFSKKAFLNELKPQEFYEL